MQTDGKRQYEKRRQTAIDIKGLADRRTARDSKRRAERQQETVRGNQTDGKRQYEIGRQSLTEGAGRQTVRKSKGQADRRRDTVSCRRTDGERQ
jgi:hypothetical protein